MFGRRKGYLVTCAFTCLFGVCSGLAQDVHTLTAMRFFVGVGLGAPLARHRLLTIDTCCAPELQDTQFLGDSPGVIHLFGRRGPRLLLALRGVRPDTAAWGHPGAHPRRVLPSHPNRFNRTRINPNPNKNLTSAGLDWVQGLFWAGGAMCEALLAWAVLGNCGSWNLLLVRCLVRNVHLTSQ